MVQSVSVVYPKGCQFNMDYYLGTHMPLVQSKWGSMGLKSWKVIKYDENSAYSVQATLEWETAEEWGKAATSAEAKEIFGDVVNFTDGKPEVLKGEVAAFQSL